MLPRLLCWAFLVAIPIRADDRMREALDRLIKEAARFQQAAPDLQSEESLVQRAMVVPKKKFRPSLSQDGKPKQPDWQSREIVSEYGFAALDSTETIREIRRAIAVDGHSLESSDQAIARLAAALRSNDDHQKRKLLEDFEKLGLIGTVTDFGQVLLLFHSRHRDEFEYRFAGMQLIGAERAVVVGFRQTEGAARMTVIEGKRAIHQRMSGTIAFRESDLTPIRVQVIAVSGIGNLMVRQEAEVEYIMSQFQVLVPVSVVHREFRAENLVAENRFRYKPFMKLGDGTSRPTLK